VGLQCPGFAGRGLTELEEKYGTAKRAKHAKGCGAFGAGTMGNLVLPARFCVFSVVCGSNLFFVAGKA
jgi:hypothetical protein